MMRVLFQAFVLFAVVLCMASCSVPLYTGRSANNDTYMVDYLFEHDGVKVYRFYDRGNYVYFTTRGEATAVKSDSVHVHTISVPADTVPIIKYPHK